MASIEVRNLSMHFSKFIAVDDVSFKVEDGEFVTLLGPSGCGKTTLLNLLSGFLTPTSGKIVLDEVDITRVPPELRDTAMCFQSYALFPHLSVQENLSFGLRQQGIPAAARLDRIAKVTDQLDLKANLQKLPNQLSGGQQQRVALGRALAVRPGVILFDEPLSNLDAKLRESVRYEIRSIQKQYGLTAIYVTHDQAEALAMSDRVFVMNGGRVEQVGSPETIYHQPATSFVADFIGAANILEAEVQSQSGDRQWQIETPIGCLTVDASDPPSANRLRVCWRPEHGIEGGASVNALSAKVHHRSFQGNFTDLTLDLDGTSQRLQVPNSTVMDGDGITFSIPPHTLHFLEPIQ